MRELDFYLTGNIPNRYYIGDIVVTTCWSEYLNSPYQLPSYTECKIVAIEETDGCVWLEPLDIDVEAVYEELDEWDYDYDDDRWEDAEYRVEDMYEERYIFNIEDIEPRHTKGIDNGIFPSSPYLSDHLLLGSNKEKTPLFLKFKEATPLKKLSFQKLSTLLKEKTRGFMAKASGFFKSKDVTIACGEGLLHQIQQAEISFYNGVVNDKKKPLEKLIAWAKSNKKIKVQEEEAMPECENEIWNYDIHVPGMTLPF